jgi:hypothetical protein
MYLSDDLEKLQKRALRIIFPHLSYQNICPTRTFVLPEHLSYQNICPTRIYSTLQEADLDVIYEQRERVFHRDIQTLENNVWKHEREARVFSYIVFECLDISVRHELELFIWLASQMNRDVTECFRLLIWIEFLTKHNVIRNSIQVILHA